MRALFEKSRLYAFLLVLSLILSNVSGFAAIKAKADTVPNRAFHYGKKLKVNFVNEKGTVLRTQEVQKGTVISEPKFKRIVSRWYVKGDKNKSAYDFNKPVSDDMTLVAVYSNELAELTPDYEKQNKTGDTPPPTEAKPPYGEIGAEGWAGNIGFQVNYNCSNKDFEKYCKELEVYQVDKNGRKICELSRDYKKHSKYYTINGSSIGFYEYSSRENTYFFLVSKGYKTVLMTVGKKRMYKGELRGYEIGFVPKSFNVTFFDEENKKIDEQTVRANDKIKDPLIDGIDYFYVRGGKNDEAYDFSKFMGYNNIELIGVRQKKAKVHFLFQDEGSLPDMIKKLKPEDIEERFGESYTPRIPFDTEIKDKNGIVWLFKGWNPEKIERLGMDNTFTGSWERKDKLSVTYKFKSEDSNKKLPDSVTNLLKDTKYAKKSVSYHDDVFATEKPKDEIDAVGGVWIFDRWEHESFKKIEDNKEFVGIWKFIKKDNLKVTINHESDTEGKTLPKDNINFKSQTKEVAFFDTFTPDDLTGKKVHVKKGIWEFKKYSAISDKIKENQIITAYWGFNEKDKIVVDFEFRSDDEKTLPYDVTKKIPSTMYVDYYDDLDLSNLIKEDRIIVSGGVWTFEGWKKNPSDRNPIKNLKLKNLQQNTKVYGIWHFYAKNAVNVNFKYKSATDKPLPDTIKLDKNIAVKYGESVHIDNFQDIAKKGDEVAVSGGIWTFEGWEPLSFEKITENKEFVGTWRFTKKDNIKISFEFKSFDDNYSLPDEITKLKPNDESVPYNTQYDPSSKTFDDVDVEGGIWHFNSWDSGKQKLIKNKVFTGTWKFTKKEVTISFEFKSKTSGKELPEKIKDIIKSPDYSEKKIPYYTKYTPQEPTNKITDDGLIWEFKGFSKNTSDDRIKEDTIFTGYYQVVGIKYTVEYYNEESDKLLGVNYGETDSDYSVNLSTLNKTNYLDTKTHKFSKITYQGNEQLSDKVTMLAEDKVIKVYYKKNLQDLILKKIWTNIDTEKESIPEGITVDVYRYIDKNTELNDTNKIGTYEIKESDGYIRTVKVDIEPQDKNEKYEYAVKEHQVSGFIATYEKNNEGFVAAKKSNDADGLIATIENISDSTKYIDLFVLKTDKNKKELFGAVFLVESGSIDAKNDFTKNSEYTKKIATGESGAAVFRLKAGDYRIVEEKAPKGYIKSANTYYLRVSNDDTGKICANLIDTDNTNILELDKDTNTYKLFIENEKIKDNTIYKVDQNNRAIKGAVFDLYKQMSDRDNFALNVEVDNSKIGGEVFDVSAVLYESESNKTDTLDEITTKQLSEKSLKDAFDSLKSDMHYKVKFVFDNRFKGIVSYDKEDATLVLHLIRAVSNKGIAAKVDTNNDVSNDIINNAPFSENLVVDTDFSEELNIDTDMDTKANLGTTDISFSEESGMTKVVAEGLAEKDIISKDSDVLKKDNDTTDTGNTDTADIKTNDTNNNTNDITNDNNVYDTRDTNDKISVYSDFLSFDISDKQTGYVRIRSDIESNENGEITLNGIDKGNYYLRETKAAIKDGGHYLLPDVMYNFVIDEYGTLSVEDGGLIKEVSMEDGKKTYNIVNEWIADIAPSVPENPSDSNSYNTPNIPNTPDTYSSFDNFRYSKGFEEPVSKDAVIDDESTPLSKKDEEIILNEKDEDDENEDNESIGMNETLNFDNGRLKDDEIPLSAIPKTAEKMRFGFLVYLVTLLSGLVLFLGEVSDFVKRRKK